MAFGIAVIAVLAKEEGGSFNFSSFHIDYCIFEVVFAGHDYIPVGCKFVAGLVVAFVDVFGDTVTLLNKR